MYRGEYFARPKNASPRISSHTTVNTTGVLIILISVSGVAVK